MTLIRPNLSERLGFYRLLILSFYIAGGLGSVASLQQNYRLLAQYYLRIARGSSDPDLADRFRAIAADYFELAEQVGGSEPVVQQQQQAQPDEGAT